MDYLMISLSSPWICTCSIRPVMEILTFDKKKLYVNTSIYYIYIYI